MRWTSKQENHIQEARRHVERVKENFFGKSKDDRERMIFTVIISNQSD
jgi:hypothetical protein